jgi:hypothetical protein
MLLILYSLWIHAAIAEPNCYSLSRPALEGHVSVETWCYERTNDGGLEVFNIDEDVRAELAMTVDPQGWITHGSLLAGEVTIHRVHSSYFNPLALPLSEPSMLEPSSRRPSIEQINEARAIFERFAKDPTVSRYSTMASEGTLRAQARRLPFRGSSWTFKSKEMFRGPDSPTAKFDRYFRRKEGLSLGLSQWEARRHSSTYWWGGHCNGWAVSSIIRAEPVRAVWDKSVGITFQIGQLKGLLAAKDFCAKIAMFGRRHSGSGADRTDISAALFHKTLLYYIGELGKPLAVDYRNDRVVDTHVITGYRIRLVQRQPGVLKVATSVDIHKYDARTSNRTGPAPVYKRDYVYDLFVDDAGTITGGRWSSANPDFIYSPLGPQYCANRHPDLTEERLQKILKLPKVY